MSRFPPGILPCRGIVPLGVFIPGFDFRHHLRLPHEKVIDGLNVDRLLAARGANSRD